MTMCQVKTKTMIDLILMKCIFYMYMYLVKCVLESHPFYLQICRK